MVEIYTKRQARIFIQEEVERQLENRIIKIIDICFERIARLEESIKILSNELNTR